MQHTSAIDGQFVYLFTNVEGPVDFCVDLALIDSAYGDQVHLVLVSDQERITAYLLQYTQTVLLPSNLRI